MSGVQVPPPLPNFPIGWLFHLVGLGLCAPFRLWGLVWAGYMLGWALKRTQGVPFSPAQSKQQRFAETRACIAANVGKHSGVRWLLPEGLPYIEMEMSMRAIVILEASRPDGSMYRLQTTEDIYVLGCLKMIIGL